MGISDTLCEGGLYGIGAVIANRRRAEHFLSSCSSVVDYDYDLDISLINLVLV